MNDAFRAGLTLAAALLGGCAQVNWERGLYQGLNESAQRAARRHGPAALPDPKLPPVGRYEQERERLRAAP
jgi:hypothetical protein